MLKTLIFLVIFCLAHARHLPTTFKTLASFAQSFKFPYNNSEEIDTIKLVIGKIDYSNLESFVYIDDIKYAKKKIFLDNETFEQFKLMQCAFYDSLKNSPERVEHIDMLIFSGVRSFEQQQTIWETKWSNCKKTSTSCGKRKPKCYGHLKNENERALEILKYSAMPMTSRHHWGTDIDINFVHDCYFLNGEGKILYEWLSKNAATYGFYQVYSNKQVSNRTGYEEEKWHWSYLPKAKKYLAFYNKNISDKDIIGFKGSDQAEKVEMVKNYVNGITAE
jgi:LAS superfamily LD-carboxypeptidase LdcB